MRELTGDPACLRCGLLCLIRHKAQTLEVSQGSYVYFHDATPDDCWEQEKRDDFPNLRPLVKELDNA